MQRVSLLALALVACGPLDPRELAPFPCGFDGCPEGLYCVNAMCQTTPGASTGSTGMSGPTGNPAPPGPSGSPAGYQTLTTASDVAAGVAIDASDVYFARWTVDKGSYTWSVSKVPKTGGAATKFAGTTEMSNRVLFFAADAGKVFYATFNTIYSATTTPTTLVAESFPSALHVYAGRLYWARGNQLRSCPTSGCAGAPTDVTLPSSMSSAAFADNRLAWVSGDGTAPKEIRSCTLPLCSAPTLVATQSAYSFANIFVDSSNVYGFKHTSYVDNKYTDSLVMRCPNSASGCTQVASLTASETGGGVSAETQIYYIAESILYVAAPPTFVPSARGKVGSFYCPDGKCLAADASSVYIAESSAITKVSR